MEESKKELAEMENKWVQIQGKIIEIRKKIGKDE